MKKILISVFLYFVMATHAGAHTGLENTVPQNGAVLKKAPTQIVLTFSSKVESAGALVLKNEKGEIIPLRQVDILNDEVIAKFEENLPNNQYKLEWEIIGMDGHPIEGILEFNVQSPLQKTEKIKPVKENLDEVKLSDKKISQTTIYLLLGGLAMAAFVSITILVRRPPR